MGYAHKPLAGRPFRTDNGCSSKRTSGWPARRASCSAVAAIAVACLWLLPQGLHAQDAPGGVSNGLSVWYEASHGFSDGTSPTWECRAPASCTPAGVGQLTLQYDGASNGNVERIPGAMNFNPALHYSGRAYMGSTSNLNRDHVVPRNAGSGFGVGFVSDMLLSLVAVGATFGDCGSDRCDTGMRPNATNFGKRQNATTGQANYATGSENGPTANVYGFWASTGSGHANTRNGMTGSGTTRERGDVTYQLRLGSFPGYAYSQGNNSYTPGVSRLAEGFYYSRQVTAEEAQRISSYLAIKYGITLDADATRRNATNFQYVSSSDSVVWDGDNAAYSGFHSNVIGIAKDGVLDQRISRSVNGGNGTTFANQLDILTLAHGVLASPGAFVYTWQTNAAGDGPGDGPQLQEGQFLMVGRNDGAVDASTAATVSGNGTTADGRWRLLNRRWRAQNTGGVGVVSLRFQLPAGGVTALGGDLNRVVLLVDNDNNLANGGTRVVTTGRAVSGNDISFNVTLADGEVFTLAYGVPALTKTFSPSAIVTGGISTLTFNLTHHAPDPVTGINFTDTLPTQVRVAATPNIRTSCPSGGAMTGSLPGGMSVTATPNTNVIQVVGASIDGAGASAVSCQIAVDVTSDVVGEHHNAAANISGTSNLDNLVGDEVLEVMPVPLADLSVSKTSGTGAVLGGEEIVYTILVANAGPSAADGSVVKDVPASGLTCTLVTCGSETGGAACPASPDINDLLGGGLSIPILPANSSVTFEVTCTVD